MNLYSFDAGWEGGIVLVADCLEAAKIKARAFCEEQEWSVEYTNELVHGLREHSLDKIINLRGDS